MYQTEETKHTHESSNAALFEVMSIDFLLLDKSASDCCY